MYGWFEWMMADDYYSHWNPVFQFEWTRRVELEMHYWTISWKKAGRSSCYPSNPCVDTMVVGWVMTCWYWNVVPVALWVTCVGDVVALWATCCCCCWQCLDVKKIHGNHCFVLLLLYSGEGMIAPSFVSCLLVQKQ